MQAPVTDNLIAHHGKAILYRAFFSSAESDKYLAYFLKEMPWAQRPVKLFGKEIMQPRLTVSFADKGAGYGYSGVMLKSLAWTAELREIKSRVEKACGYKFNTALLNLYRQGDDYMGWHRDNEKNLGAAPAIASLSFGARRKFQLRNYTDKKEIVTVELGHGDLLIMSAELQKCWEHGLPKAAGVVLPRINITFRRIY